MNGKGDRYRDVDKKRYNENFDLIFKKKKKVKKNAKRKATKSPRKTKA